MDFPAAGARVTIAAGHASATISSAVRQTLHRSAECLSAQLRRAREEVSSIVNVHEASR